MESSAERNERLIDEALVAALTGDQREDYIEALLERAEVMKEFNVEGVSIMFTQRQAAGAAGSHAGGDPGRDRGSAQAAEFAIGAGTEPGAANTTTTRRGS
ncbi:hypothetical protein AXA44_44435 [Rhodococcus sp. SC4]|nr:hypothetical protein AXA44_44435 [Rhodococcus sp. SC4]